MSMGVLRTIFTKNEPIGKDDTEVVEAGKRGFARCPALPHDGQGPPGRGTGPRLTDRKHYK